MPINRGTQRMKLIPASLLAIALSLPASAATPADALSRARALIENKEYREAAEALNKAIEAAHGIPQRSARMQALSALHFFSSVAYAGLGEDGRATAELTEFFVRTPRAASLDTARYERHFITLFNELLKKRERTTDFNVYYPGLTTLAEPEAGDEKPDFFASNPALLILGSAAERRKFETLVSAADQEAFLDDFWKRRDPTPETPLNEFRETFLRRAAFAERVFGTPDSLGPMTDRGKVFILLGEPDSFRHGPIPLSSTYNYTGPAFDGELEEWTYRADQLPVKIKGPSTITYRFLTQGGVDDHVLLRQRSDQPGMKVLEAAGNPSGKPE